MPESEEMPRQPSRLLSLGTHDQKSRKKDGPARGVQPNGSSTDDSLFGNFVKDRQDVVEFDVDIEVPLKRKGLKKSSSTSKLTNLRHRRQGSRSPGESIDPPRPRSVRSLKSRSRSPAVRNEDLATKSSPKPTSPKGVHPKIPGERPTKGKSPTGLKRSHHGKSPKNPKKSTSKDEPGGGLSVYPGLEAPSPRSMKEKFVAPTINIDDDIDDIPGLVDDSVIRETLEGQRGGKQWNILEDTPGGHAEEKMVMVAAIENDEQSNDCVLDDSDLLEEDDDINDDTDEHSVVVARSRRRNSLPLDPSSAGTSGQGQDIISDRFAPSFNNNDMWKGGAQLDKQLPPVKRTVSSEASIISDAPGADDLESLGDGTPAFIDNQDDHALTPEEDISKGKDDDEEGTNAKTLATTKRNGGRRIGSIESVPNLEADLVKAGIEEEEIVPLSVPESTPLDATSKRKSRRKKKPPSSSRASTSRNEKKGSNSTGRSSHRQTADRPRKERDALHSRRHRKIPDVVPLSAGSDGMVRSPLSSSLTSTPTSNSLMSSGRSHQQNQSLQALRHYHSQTSSSPKRRPNKSLTHHVESSRDRSPPADGDEHTLGASTITTNFSTTQRTRGDNTVSTRSLFQSDLMSSSETPRLPQRRNDGSDFDDDSDDDDGGQKNPPSLPKRSEDEFSTEVPDTTTITAEDLFTGKATVETPLGVGECWTVLRRPSGEGDDMLSMIESTHQSKSSEDLSLGSSEGSNSLKRWHKEHAIALQAHRREHVDGIPHTKAFLQLNPGDQGVVVESEVADVADLKSPMTTSVASEIPPAVGLADDGAEQGDQNVEKVDGTAAAADVHVNERVYGVGQSPTSPRDSPKKNKKKSRLGLFKRVVSWKGAVPLKDEDDGEK